MTTREIAQLAGVSAATVSRYLTGNERISENTIEKIEAVIKNYNLYGKFERKKLKLIALVLPSIVIDYYVAIIENLFIQAENFGFEIVIMTDIDSTGNSVINMIRKLKPSGLIVVSDHFNEPILNLLSSDQKHPLQVVYCGGTTYKFDCAMVHIDDLKASYEGMKYLLDRGHTEIAILSDLPHSIDISFKRVAGCRRALEERGMSLNDNLIKFGRLTYENGYKFAKEIFSQNNKVSAVFAFSDQLALGAMNYLLDNGYNVPRDVSVMGFDDLDITTRVRPQLTTIRQPIDDIVKKTLEFFTLEKIDNSLTISIPHSIVVRDSVSDNLKKD